MCFDNDKEFCSPLYQNQFNLFSRVDDNNINTNDPQNLSFKIVSNSLKNSHVM